MSKPSVLILDRLNFVYPNPETHALKDVYLDLKRGEAGAILGHSGAGKSTLIRCINGTIPNLVRGELTGNINVVGKDPRETKTNDIASLVGVVYQDFETQLFSTNVLLEVAFGPENFAIPRDEILRRVHKYLRAVRLQGLEKRQPATLSGGQKQRLAIASVLALEPELICFDEPTTDLDPIGKSEIFSILRELRAQRDVTTLVVEHETAEVRNSDRIMLMKKGEIKKSGSAKEVLTDVEACRECGVLPLQTAELFGKLGLEDPVLSVDESLEKIHEHNLAISVDKYENIIREERQSMASCAETVIDISNLVHIYPNGVEALKGVNLKIQRGEFVAIVGQNGGGKTTLMKHFNGLLKPSEGKVVAAGCDTSQFNVTQLGRIVQYVFQNPDHQIFAETVADEVGFGPKLYGLSERDVKARVEEALAAVKLDGYEDQDPFSLTKDGRQAVAVASVLATKPEVIILDEPTTGLDLDQLQHMMNLITRLNGMGHTIIVVTHSMWVVSQYAPRTVILSDGEIALDGSTREVFRQEETLRNLYLKPPQIVTLSNALGCTLLTVDEVAGCLTRSD